MSFPVRLAVFGSLVALAGCATKDMQKTVDSTVHRQAIDANDLPSLARYPIKPQTSESITITSPGFKPGGEIPYKYSDYGEKISPELIIGNVPPAAVSLVVFCEDPDAPIKPFIHWVLFNVPPDRTHLRESMPGEMRLRDLGDANQGLNSHGSVGYTGPRPPYEDPAHHYHFQVFALDRKLDLAPGTERNTVLAAMQGHVIAAGEVIGTYRAAK
ncbi:MAG: hypothetical protein JWM57_3643 [Phycisphaerales bacterium]|nr:hypothetical protein [Phycisphaerales bacterium]